MGMVTVLSSAEVDHHNNRKRITVDDLGLAPYDILSGAMHTVRRGHGFDLTPRKKKVWC